MKIAILAFLPLTSYISTGFAADCPLETNVTCRVEKSVFCINTANQTVDLNSTIGLPSSKLDSPDKANPNDNPKFDEKTTPGALIVSAGDYHTGDLATIYTITINPYLADAHSLDMEATFMTDKAQVPTPLHCHIGKD